MPLSAAERARRQAALDAAQGELEAGEKEAHRGEISVACATTAEEVRAWAEGREDRAARSAALSRVEAYWYNALLRSDAGKRVSNYDGKVLPAVLHAIDCQKREVSSTCFAMRVVFRFKSNDTIVGTEAWIDKEVDWKVYEEKGEEQAITFRTSGVAFHPGKEPQEDKTAEAKLRKRKREGDDDGCSDSILHYFASPPPDDLANDWPDVFDELLLLADDPLQLSDDEDDEFVLDEEAEEGEECDEESEEEREEDAPAAAEGAASTFPGAPEAGK